MPAAYSYDLRKKAMEALEEGGRRETVAAKKKRNRRLSIKKTWKWRLYQFPLHGKQMDNNGSRAIMK